MNELTKREKEVLNLLMDGKNARQIAKIMNITYATVKAHTKAIFEKTYTHSQLEVVCKTYKEIIERMKDENGN